MSIDDQMHEAVMGVGRKEAKTPEQIVEEVNANMPESLADALRETPLTIPVAMPQLSPEEEKLFIDWVANLVPLEKELEDKIVSIRDEVMKHLGYTDASQLMPIGLKGHLHALCRHRFNYPLNYKVDIKDLEAEELRSRLYFMNLLLTLETCVLMLTTNQYKGCIEKMTNQDIAQGTSQMSAKEVAIHLQGGNSI